MVEYTLKIGRMMDFFLLLFVEVKVLASKVKIHNEECGAWAT